MTTTMTITLLTINAITDLLWGETFPHFGIDSINIEGVVVFRRTVPVHGRARTEWRICDETEWDICSWHIAGRVQRHLLQAAYEAAK